MKDLRTFSLLSAILFSVLTLSAQTKTRATYGPSMPTYEPISIVLIDMGAIDTYPNSVSGQYSVIEVKLPAGVKEGMIHLLNKKGSVVKEYKVNDGLQSIYLSSDQVAPGDYSITLETTAGKINQEELRIN